MFSRHMSAKQQSQKAIKILDDKVYVIPYSAIYRFPFLGDSHCIQKSLTINHRAFHWNLALIPFLRGGLKVFFDLDQSHSKLAGMLKTSNDTLTNHDCYAKKLSPYEFFNSMGKPRYIVAPMVDHSDLSYRMLTRKYGAQLVYTQMFSSNCFVQSAELRSQLFTTCPEDRPLIVQFCGNDPQTLLSAARFIENHCDAVDINLGCPQGIAKRGHYGAFLMEELELLTSIVSTLSQGLKVPVTCKTRIYRNDFERSVKLCETLVQAGASMLTIHGRSREEKGNLVADCDWSMIARLKAHFGDRIPIIANGGIESMDDVQKCLNETMADGVMTSEAILENPALFTRNLNDREEFRTQIDLAGSWEAEEDNLF
jgi:tRNA-dihydrouridine synthase